MKAFLKSGLAVAVLAASVGAAEAREQLRIVGSSTVYPFSSYVAEELGATSDFPTPVIESTGSGGGMKLFCEGVGDSTPDITNASRRMKTSEFERCEENGVTDITEAMIGFDGIAFAQAVGDGDINLTREQITLAVAAQVPVDGKLVDNPYTKWSEIDSSLPDRKITVYGPPSTSGTRDAFEELVMEVSTEEMEGYGGEGYTNIRQDGHYIAAGENDNLIIQKLVENTDAFGIFGYSFLEENADKVVGASIDGVLPEADAISSGEYPVSRSLFYYVKNQHKDDVPAQQAYNDLFMSEKMIGELGYLKGIGLIPLPKDEREALREQVKNRTKLTLADLKK
ncbi:phosphate-binding protein [Cobetia marina]|jgi:phosphate transport system substrate-binding protein|uniref:Substrate-binding domain-containing protein n=1 Tax=Cobetia marina TaxID=28258 RepID=A0ABU9GBE2_COBMA|nr:MULTISPECIES: substrate-binding domain-containing protein [Cobetia]AOM02245.1 phosphate-binding protein [Cobetia marina]MDA5563166.1 substrate-binding domain-containing protein [Cobetia sp. MMG027]MDH2292604.1 substrate-binding domain-containing protein [Cobetia sp. 10Alg 146]MDH2375500.1 substrate-binding domain-containing protein [Cobetia sp. 3AK]MDI6003388.1 substrate-binding domain-containing protein [Cobetia pacifica]